MNNFRVVVSNQRVSPYTIGKDDYLNVKVVLNNNENLSYLEGIAVDLYLNYAGDFELYSTGTTNDKGIAFLYYNAKLITEQINNCLGYVKLNIDSQEYVSNTVRFNFIGTVDFATELELYPAELILYNSEIILM